MVEWIVLLVVMVPAISVLVYTILHSSDIKSGRDRFVESSGEIVTKPEGADTLVWHSDEIEKFKESPHRSQPLHLPFRPLGDLLKGREAELAILAKGLEGPATGTYATTQGRLEAIHGLGGVGKTALAVEHAWQCRERYSGVFFVRAETPAELRAGLAELASEMGLKAEDDEAVAMAAALGWLEGHTGWLLILDNVDDEEAAAAVNDLLPDLLSGRVLITSRLRNWSGRVRRIPLAVLAPEQARAFLLERAPQRVHMAGEGEETAALAEELGYLPLALEQAAAFVDVHGQSFADYRKRLEDESEAVLTWYDPDVMDYPRSLAATWKRSFDRLGLSAQAMLHLVALLAPERIPRSLFEGEKAERVLRAVVEDFDLAEAKRELLSYSFLQATAEGFGVHRMVQEVVRSRFDPTRRQEWAGRAVELLVAAYPGDPEDARNWAAWRLHRPHAERVIRQALAEGVHHTKLSTLMNQAAVYLLQLALYSEAEPLYRHALAIDESSYGEQHPAVAIRLSNLATLLKATNRLSEAEPLMRRALAIDESSYGEEHPTVAIRLNNLAQLLKATNRLSEAEPLMRRALAIDDSNYGEEHPTVARDLNNLAALLKATNRLSEAEPLMRRALAIDESSYDEEHPTVARDLSNLAQLLQATNRLSEAEPLMRRALAINESSYGGEHPTVARDLNSLAALFQVTDRLSEAEPLLQRALAIDESRYGEEHPTVALSLNNLAQLLKATDRLSEAEPLMRHALAIDESSYGEQHPTVARDLNNLAQLLKATDRLSEAEPLMRRALAIDESSYGEQHPAVARDLNNLATLLQDLDQLDEALPLMKRAFDIWEASLVDGHPWREGARANLAAMLQARGEAEDK